MTGYVGALDQGTTSSRFILFDKSGAIRGVAQREHRQIRPRPGWVEHDPIEIVEVCRALVDEGLRAADATTRDLAAIGITNQRETTVVWDRASGRPIHNAIVWQDTRTADICAELSKDPAAADVTYRTGLPISTYFSGPKVRWLLDSVDGARRSAESGELAFGTIDSWLTWNLTGGVATAIHATDVTNASRTLLFDLERLDWDDDALGLIGVPRALLPQVKSSSEVYGAGSENLDGVPIAGILGDQHAALLGQLCTRPGDAKNTYGTGCFLLLNTGERPVRSKAGLLTTLGYKLGSAAPVYALEGSIAFTGALVNWLRDNLGLITTLDEVEPLARSVDDTAGVYIVPAFGGLFAPHWRTDARGVIVGLTAFATRAHLVRAALEAAAWQTLDVLDAMRSDAGVDLKVLKVDGGMTRNDLLLQLQADAIGTRVVRPRVTETTALGAAYAAGLAVGFWSDLDELAEQWQADREWQPQIATDERERRHAAWLRAVERSFGLA